MEDQLGTIRALAEEIGPRPPTSAAEANAAAYVNANMRQAGLDVDVQTFRSVTTFSLPYGLLFLIAALSPLVYRYSRPGALAMSLLALAGFVAEVLSLPALSAWLPGGKSQNIVGTRPAAQEPRQHLIVMAHLDSPRSALFFHPRFVAHFHRFFLLTAIAMLALPVLIILAWTLNAPWLWYVQWAPAAYLTLIVLLLIHSETLMPHTAGANDNASGVAVLLRLAQELDNLQHTNLWLVSTGAKEAGMAGARSFLRQYPFPKERSYILNLDGVGRGQVCIIVEEGMLWSHQADPFLVELAGQADAGDIRIDAEPRTYHLLNTDAQVALVRGFRALTIMALEQGGPSNWHWSSDTVDQIEPLLPDRATRLVRGIARRLDRGIGASQAEEAPRQADSEGEASPSRTEGAQAE